MEVRLLRLQCMRPTTMKISLLVLVVLFAAAAFGQSAPVIPNRPQPIQFEEHPQHASPHSLADESPIAGGSAAGYSYATGELPLWQFGHMTEPTPLGDVARAYRREKLGVAKATIVFEKQGL